MDQDKLEIIKELMGELMGDMEPSKDDFDERLGKPKVEVMKMQSDEPMDGGDMFAMDGDEDMASPEDKLKDRLMKLRG